MHMKKLSAIGMVALAPVFVPGTSMFFNGIKKDEERHALIAYLLIESRKP